MIQKLTIAILIIISAPVCCIGQDNNMEEKTQALPYILQETADNIEYLVNVSRDDRENNYLTWPHLGNGDFFLHFGIINQKKEQDASYSRRYTMYVIPKGDSFCLKTRMDALTFYENGENVGHARPTGQWSDCSDEFRPVLDYYLSHKTEIIIYVDNVSYDKIDIGDKKPLLTISEESGQYLIDIWKNDSLPQYGNGDFILEIEMLIIPKAVDSDGVPIIYSIAGSTIHFIPMNGRYFIRNRERFTTTYMNRGKDKTDLSVPDRWEDVGYADESLHYRKLLEYYQSHQSQIRVAH